jgi:hypothetical protein
MRVDFVPAKPSDWVVRATDFGSLIAASTPFSQQDFAFRTAEAIVDTDMLLARWRSIRPLPSRERAFLLRGVGSGSAVASTAVKVIAAATTKLRNAPAVRSPEDRLRRSRCVNLGSRFDGFDFEVSVMSTSCEWAGHFSASPQDHAGFDGFSCAAPCRLRSPRDCAECGSSPGPRIKIAARSQAVVGAGSSPTRS